MNITESREKDVLNWLDDHANDNTLNFNDMASYRDAALLIRQKKQEIQDAFQDGLDEGRRQGLDRAGHALLRVINAHS